MPHLAPLATITLRDLRARIRDRSVIVLGILAPLGLSLIFSLTSSGPDMSRLPVGRVGTPASTTTDALDALARQKLVTVRDYESASAARAAISKGTIKAAMRVTAPTPTSQGSIDVWTDPDESTAAQLLDGAARATALRMDAVSRAAIGASGGRPTPTDITAAMRAVLGAPSTVTLDSQRVPGLTMKATSAAGMAAFFLFFTVQVGVLGLLEERREGTLARLLAAPVPPWQILGAKILTSWLIGILSLTVLLIGTHLLMDVHWGSPLGLACLVATGSLAATSTITLVAGVARTPEAASVAQSMLALVLGMLGGSFFSLSRGGGIGATVTQLTPHYWFREGLARLAGGAPWTQTLVPSMWLVACALVIGIPGILLARRAVRP